MKKESKLMVEFINNICEKNYSDARKNLAGVVDEKIKGRIKEMASRKDKDA